MTDDLKSLPRTRGGGLVYLAGVVAVIFVAGLVFLLGRSRREAAATERQERVKTSAAGVPVTTAKVTPAPPTLTLDLPGDVKPFRQATIYAKVSGYLREVRVDRGDIVKANDVIGVVSVPETDQQISSLEAQLVSKKQLAERTRALVPAGVASQAELDRADSDLKASQAEVDRLVAVRGYDTIRAPWGGTITARYADPGALLPAATGSTQSAQPLVDLVDMSKCRIVVYLGQIEAQLVKEGDPVAIVRDAAPANPISAVITRIPRALDPRTRTMPVEIWVDNPDSVLYPGLYVHVRLTVKAPPTLALPSDAVFVRAGKPTVAKLDGGKARFTEVQVADDDGKTVRITSGLAAADEVILHVGDEISDGAPVQPVKPEPPPAPPGAR